MCLFEFCIFINYCINFLFFFSDISNIFERIFICEICDKGWSFDDFVLLLFKLKVKRTVTVY